MDIHRRIPKPLLPIVAAAGGLMTALGYLFDGIQIITLGLPIWAWQAIGTSVFVMTTLVIVLHRSEPKSDEHPNKDGSLSFYRDRGEMTAATGGLSTEVRSASVVWHATFAGNYAVTNELFRYHQFQRLIVLHPAGDYVEMVAPTTNETAEQLRARIEHVTADAQKHGVEVRWFDGPILGMTFLNPGSDDGSVRAEIFAPFSGIRAGFRISKEDELYGEMYAAFDQLWKASVPAGTAVEQSRQSLREELQGIQRYRQIAEAERDLLASDPLRNWARSLIERERKNAFSYLTVQTTITNGAHLLGDNPYLDVVINVDYRGVLEGTLAETIDGRLIYGEPLADRPDPLNASLNGTLPARFSGPGGASIRLRQYLRDGVRDQIVASLDNGAPEIEFAHDLAVSLKLDSFDGESIYTGTLNLPMYITQAVKQPWRSGLGTSADQQSR